MRVMCVGGIGLRKKVAAAYLFEMDAESSLYDIREALLNDPFGNVLE
jgi:hypothetical protein